MKKYISITLILTLLISCFTILPSYGATLSGNGTEENPYIINSAADFMQIKESPSAYYLLNKDIVLPSGFVPFDFSGSLIGKDTKNLPSITINIAREGTNEQNPLGLFKFLRGKAQIKNICLKGSITGSDYVGGFAGK